LVLAIWCFARLTSSGNPIADDGVGLLSKAWASTPAITVDPNDPPSTHLSRTDFDAEHHVHIGEGAFGMVRIFDNTVRPRAEVNATCCAGAPDPVIYPRIRARPCCCLQIYEGQIARSGIFLDRDGGDSEQLRVVVKKLAKNAAADLKVRFFSVAAVLTLFSTSVLCDFRPTICSRPSATQRSG